MKNLIVTFLKFIAILFLLSNISYSLEGHLFPPLTANLLEPRIGCVFQLTEKKLRLDIGTSVDLFEFDIRENSKIRIGTDFFTLSRLRSEGNMKFPVETADYFFGLNGTTKGKALGLNYSARLRLAHISSHIVDGLANDTILTRKPYVYSREFAELTQAINFDELRCYAGITYVFSRQPKSTNAIIPQFGFDYKYKMNEFMNIILGYDFKLSGYNNDYFGAHSAQAGIEFVTVNDIGILISGYYFKGKSIHGMFYNENESYAGAGFQVVY
ncbi:MAG: DUF1207 domain-containing protein [Bacteroidetes bacterium]|nr:DUF1207 domain-containing protein [Bacteroidota bacterium]